MDRGRDREPARAVAAARRIASLSAGRADAQDRDDGFPAADILDLARLGLLAAPVPAEEGGDGLGGEPGAADLAEVLRLVGSGSLALGRLYEGHVNALDLVLRYAAPAERRALLADAVSGHLFGVWNTEPPTGGLVLDEDGSLRGRKTFASGAGRVTRALVTARRPGRTEPEMLVVALDPGTRADLSAWRAQGMRASATGTVDLTGLAPLARLGEPDDYHREPHFSGGAWRFAAVQLGGIEAVFEAWRGHLSRTGRGADPHQLARLGEGAIALEGARLFVARAAGLVADETLAPGRIVAFVGLTRLAVERAGLEVLGLAQRSVGLQGFLSGHPLERLSRDLATYLRQPAPDRALTAAAATILAAGEPADRLWVPGGAG
ncbi:acyl-CoA dehydrogenase [Methylobacterium indicum]|nr:acyl-CoA dehydrogenase [Methylobacterium indicum]KTS40094.1 acyl-CoA dehydrogenase [Methylobacterium indicum]KTS54327.1 acyl-CoA dehydrogenase [Methylobacterium indicum]